MFFTNIYIYIYIRYFCELKFSGTGIHGYEYYDTRTRPVNMRVLKILVPASSGYPFLIFVSYSLQVLSTDTHEYEYFWHPYPKPIVNVSLGTGLTLVLSLIFCLDILYLSSLCLSLILKQHSFMFSFFW